MDNHNGQEHNTRDEIIKLSDVEIDLSEILKEWTGRLDNSMNHDIDDGGLPRCLDDLEALFLQHFGDWRTY